MTLVDTINNINNIDKKSTICIYPNVNKHNNFFEPEIFSHSKMKEITNMLNVKIKNYTQEKYTQVETFYKNLLKLTKIYKNNEIIEYYELEPSEYILCEKNLIVIQKEQILKKEEFPSLIEYDANNEKYIEIYKYEHLFDVIFETCNNQNIVKIKLLSNASANHKLEEIIKLLTMI